MEPPRIVSIGNIEAGGGGKTPFAIALCGLITREGGTPVVLLRGYGGDLSGGDPVALMPAGDATERRAANRFGRVIGEGICTDAELARLIGDEAVLYHRRGIPVAIDADRRRGMTAAAAFFSPTHIILDDAFQHPVYREVDIVLLDAEKPLGRGGILPLGSLREPVSSIVRADIIVMTRADGRTLPDQLRKLTGGKPILFARHEPAALIDRDGRERPIADLAGKTVCTYSGIARPSSFEQTASRIGAVIDTSIRFEDHHRYGQGDIELIEREAAGRPILTTEKDWVKSAGMFGADVDLFALRVEMLLDGSDGLLNTISERSSV